MSTLMELAGFGLLTFAARTLFGDGVAEAVAGAGLLILAQGVRDGAVRAAVRAIPLKVIRRPKV